MKIAGGTARTKFNKRAMAVTLVLTVLFIVMFVCSLYCFVTDTIPQIGEISQKFMKSLVGYGVYRGLTNAAFFFAIFVFYFRVHNIDDFVTQTGAYEIRWLGIVFIIIWAANVVLRFFIPNFLMPPHGLVFLGVICELVFIFVKLLANKVDMYLNSGEYGGSRRLGDMTPLQFFDFIAHLFKHD